MSSPARTPRRSTRTGSTANSPAASRSGRRSVQESPQQQNVVEPSSDLLPLPSSPINSGRTTATSDAIIPNTSPARAGNAVDLNDMSSPLNYGTPSSVGSIRTPRSTISGTPQRQRTDIRTDRRVRQVQVGTTSEAGDGERAPSVTGSDVGPRAGPQLVIWGTNVVVNTCKEQFKTFVKRFVNAEIDAVQEPLYLQKLAEIQMLEEPFFNLNCEHLQQFDGDLYRQLVSYPQEVIPTFDMAINDMFTERYPDTVLPHQIQVRPFNADKTKNMRSLNPEDIDQLLTISGMVIRVSNIIPEMREAFFRCSVCSRSATVEIDRGRIVEPVLCAGCNSGHAFALIHNRSQFTDKQMIKLQESPDDMPPGQTPHTIVLYAHNDLVDTVQPGDRVHVTGIYRAVPMRAIPRQRTMKAVYKTHIDVVHFHKVDEKRLREDNDEVAIEFSPEQIEGFKKLAKQPDIYDKLARALAPSIYENEDIKKGILLLLFGGTKKDFVNTGRGKFRAEINLLLCGDPGTSKSQLLQFVYHLVPRGQYTSGKGSSAVGLTAYITRDPETRQPVLQTGALVLSDNGVCCIDEFDKMNDSTRSILHEVMEQQTLSIAKAGIVCQLNARTSVLAAANPCESQWNKNKTVLENVKLPHTLMSRFDLIFLMLDPQNEIFDRRLARHLVSIYYRSRETEPDEHMELSVLKDYISYAKYNIRPKLSDDAGQQLIQAYLDMRRVGNGRGQISAYPRQLESLIRLSEAHAKIRLSQFVEQVDVDEAIRIYREALKQSATDPLSGKIDVSILASGVSSAVRQRRVEVAKTLKKMIQMKSYTGSLSTVKAFKELKDQMDIQLTREMFEDALKDLQDDDFLVVASKNYVRIC